MNIKLDDSKRVEIGKLICDLIQAGKDVEGRAPEWWDEMRKNHRNEGSNLDETGTQSIDSGGVRKFHIPFSAQRQDMLKAQICTVIGKQDPFMVCLDEDEDESKALSDLVHRAWKKAKFQQRIRTAASICTDTDLVYYRLCSMGNGQLEISVHNPDQVVIFPVLPTGIQDATIVGHQIYKPRRIVEATKTYYEGVADSLPDSVQDELVTVSAANRSGINVGINGPDSKKDGLIELWDVIVKLDLDDKGDKLYRATVAFDARELLALEAYPYSNHWYFESRLIGSDDYYPTTSVARSLYAIQDAFNNMISAFYEGAMAAALPPIFGPKLDSGEKYTKYGWGDYIETETQVQPWAPSAKAIIQPIPVIMQSLERYGDQVARISQNTTGSAVNAQTATEASIIAAGVAVGVEEFIANFSLDFPRMADLTLEIIESEFESFAQRLNIVDLDAQKMDAGSPLDVLQGMLQ